MVARLMAFLVWALLGGSAVFWGLQLFTHPLHAAARPATSAVANSGDLDRLFGARAQAATPAGPSEDSRFQLLGVVAPRIVADRDREGLAVIAVDGVAKTVGVGGVVDGDLRLAAVEPRGVRLARGQVAAAMTLQLPDPTQAATGVLPRAGAAPGAIPGAVMPPVQPTTIINPQGVPPALMPQPPLPGQPRRPMGITPS